jgi:hypothetical protein
LKLIQKNIEKTLVETGRGGDFLSRTPIIQEIRARIDKWNFLKLKTFCTSKETIFSLQDGTKSLQAIYVTRY